MDEIKQFLQNKRNLVSTLVLLVMLLVLPLGVYLAKVQQIFFSQAEGTYIQLGSDGNCVTTNSLGEKALKCGTAPLVLFNPFIEKEPIHTPLDSGIIAYFPFDDNSSTDSAEFMTGRKADTAATRVVDGKIGKARKMEVGTVITYKDSAALDSDHQTVAAWVNPAQGAFKVNHFPSVIGRRNNNNLGVTLEFTGYPDQHDGQMQCQMAVRDNTWRFYSYNVNSGTNKVLPNQWNLVACSYNGTELSLYINGAVTKTAVPLPQGGEAFAKLAKFKDTERGYQQLVMGRNSHGGESFNGIIDEAIIWNRALSDGELNALREGNKVNPIQPDISNELISYWSFNNDSGNTATDVKSGKNGTVTGTSLVDFRGGKARKFDAQGQEIQIPDSFDFQKDKVTVSAWVKPAGTQGFGTAHFPSFFNKRPNPGNNGFTFEQAGYPVNEPPGQVPPIARNSGQLQFQFNAVNANNAVVGSSVINTYDKIVPDVWNHIAAVYDGLEVKIYINGVISDFAYNPGKMNNPANSIIKIGRNIFTNETFIGEIDDVAYWGRGLSGLEIAQLATNRLPNGQTAQSIVTPDPEYHAPLPPLAPTVPTGFAVASNVVNPFNGSCEQGSTEITLNWTASPDATGYKVYRGYTGQTIFTEIASPTVTNFKDVGVTKGAVVYYQVSAVNAGGESPRADVSTTAAACAAVACQPPPNMGRPTATRIPGGIRVTRTAQTNANTPTNVLKGFNLTGFSNIRIDYNGKTYKNAANIPLANVASITFDVYLIDNTRGGTASFTMVDSCRAITDFQGSASRSEFGDGTPPAELPAP